MINNQSLTYAPDLLSYCCDAREIEDTGFCGHCRDYTAFYLEDEVIAQKLDENVSPDALVNWIGGDLAIRHIEVGQVMRERANRARRAVTKARNTGTYQEHITAIHAFYLLKDKWGYWRHKWGMTWTATLIEEINNV